jgi:hypothetical protein
LAAVELLLFPTEEILQSLLLNPIPEGAVPLIANDVLFPLILKKLTEQELDGGHRRHEQRGQSRDAEGVRKRRLFFFSKYLRVKVAAG